MGPRPEPTDLPKSHGTNNPDSDSEGDSDGWQVGFAVEMNGVYRQNGGSTDSSSDEDRDEGEGDHNDRVYMGYEAIRSEPVDDGQNAGPSENVPQVPPPSNLVSSSVQLDFQRALDSSAEVHLKDSDFRIPHCPQPIELDNGKIEEIKKAMSSFSLPPPSWAESIKDDDEFKRKYEAIISQGIP